MTGGEAAGEAAGPGTAFGVLRDGRPVRRLTLRRGDLSVAVLTLGAILASVRLNGVAHDLTLGSDRLEDYEGPMAYFGAIVGPVANRIGGASASIGGVLHRFDPNEAGRTTLHSGRAGLHARLWQVAEAGAAAVTLTADLPPGEGGFPGARRVTARFSLPGPQTLRLELTAVTDAPTLMNLANHSYWNLDGSDSFAGHRLRIAAPHHLPTGPDLVPTGELAAVEAGALDFRAERLVRPGQPPLDTCFCLTGPDSSGDPSGDPPANHSAGPRPLREVLWLTGASGVRMALATTEPAVQVYDAREARRPGRPAFEGLAIEAQGYPDAPNRPQFPPVLLLPGASYRQLTEWRFARP